jgi:hypothetical protein
VNSEFQTSDRLRDILRRARERSEGAATAPAAQERAHAEASVEALLDRSQPLPDPRALSRLYKEQALNSRLPESLEAEAQGASASQASAPASESPAPAPTDDGLPPPVWADAAPPAATAEAGRQPAQPAMSLAEIRSVMQRLQSEFGGSYTLYEVPKKDDYGERTAQEERDLELAELKRLADESARSNRVFLLGSLVVVLILGVFLYLAAAGPLKAPTPRPTPSATAPATPH